MIGKHINNALQEELDDSTVAKFATVQIEGDREVERWIEYYNLDVIISVGYRVKSKRGVEFRKWANSVLKQYILQGYAVNQNRMAQLGEVISHMRFGDESDLFGREKDDSFRGSIGNIYQSFGGMDLYSTLEEKAAHLLYFVTKNHSFLDGNKRIAVTMFLYFLDKNGVLFKDGEKTIDDHTLVALTIMVAESRPEEMEMMITVIMNCMK